MYAVIYARTSCTAQNACSIDDQVALCRAHCERAGWTVVGVLADQTSGGYAGHTSHARRGLVAMLSIVESGGIDRVVAETIDRIARHQSDAFAIQKRVTLAGAKLVTATESDVPDLYDKMLALFNATLRSDYMEEVKRRRHPASASSPDISAL